MPRGGPFDAVEKQRFLNGGDTLRREVAFASDIDPTSVMAWSGASLGYANIVLSWIVGADAGLRDAANDAIAYLARYSLDREDWRAWTEIVPEEDFYRRGQRSRIDHPDRPNAFVEANLVLLRDHWLRTGAVDRQRVARMFAQLMEVPVVQGVLNERQIMPLSAWPEIHALRDLPDPGGNPRPDDAGRRIGQLLADDPAQLHDPKSPARKKARAHMRESMSPRWLAGGLAVQAMDWLQTFEWREGESGLSPREVLLRAYAYMPDVEPPADIAAEVEQLRRLPI